MRRKAKEKYGKAVSRNRRAGRLTETEWRSTEAKRQSTEAKRMGRAYI